MSLEIKLFKWRYNLLDFGANWWISFWINISFWNILYPYHYFALFKIIIYHYSILLSAYFSINEFFLNSSWIKTLISPTQQIPLLNCDVFLWLFTYYLDQSSKVCLKVLLFHVLDLPIQGSIGCLCFQNHRFIPIFFYFSLTMYVIIYFQIWTTLKIFSYSLKKYERCFLFYLWFISSLSSKLDLLVKEASVCWIFAEFW